jgi:hypothetical protein
MDFRCIKPLSPLWHGFAIISVTLVGGTVSPQRIVFIYDMDFRCINLFSHLWHGFAIISVTLVGGMISPQCLVFIYGMGHHCVFFIFLLFVAWIRYKLSANIAWKTKKNLCTRKIYPWRCIEIKWRVCLRTLVDLKRKRLLTWLV